MPDPEMGVDGTGGVGAPTVLPPETAYSVLADRRRRYTVHFLKQTDGPVPVRELAEQVAAWENDKPIDEITSQERKRVYIALYQSHLPTLAKEGVVDYDEDRGTVDLSDAMSGWEVYIEVVPRGNVPWYLYYVALVAIDTLLLALGYLDVYPFGRVPDIAWGAIVIVTFAASAFVQTYQSRQMRLGDAGPPPELR